MPSVTMWMFLLSSSCFVFLLQIVWYTIKFAILLIESWKFTTMWGVVITCFGLLIDYKLQLRITEEPHKVMITKNVQYMIKFAVLLVESWNVYTSWRMVSTRFGLLKTYKPQMRANNCLFFWVIKIIVLVIINIHLQLT